MATFMSPDYRYSVIAEAKFVRHFNSHIMNQNIKKAIIACFCTFTMIGCGSDETQASSEEDATVYPKARLWAQAADSCNSVLIDQFMNKEKGTFYACAHDAMPDRTKFLYWQQAHLMDVLVYAYERVKDDDPQKAATYENHFKLWVANHANNWYDWQGHGDTTGFLNEFIDDMAWITCTLIHMSEATGDDSYFNLAQAIYDTHIITQAREDGKGRALPWKSTDPTDQDTRYVCTNAPACLAACKLYMKLKTHKYLEDARSLYSFITTNLLKSDGRLEEPPLTYTQGTFAEAARLLYHITDEADYMKKAQLAINYTILNDRCLDPDRKLLRHEGTNDDQAIFKAVFIPYAVNLVLDEEAGFTTRKEVKAFLLHNAETLWFGHTDRNTWPDTYCGFYWGETYSVAQDANRTAYACAQGSGASLLENVARMCRELKE